MFIDLNLVKNFESLSSGIKYNVWAWNRPRWLPCRIVSLPMCRKLLSLELSKNLLFELSVLFSFLVSGVEFAFRIFSSSL